MHTLVLLSIVLLLVLLVCGIGTLVWLYSPAARGSALYSRRTEVNQRFYDYRQVYPFLESMQRNYRAIQRELRGLEWYEWPEKFLYRDNGTVRQEWKVFPLLGFGVWHERNAASCPKTVALLKQLPGLRTALFSRLGPGTQLQPHQGWASLANDVLRCHLPLVVPPGNKTFMRVEGEKRVRREGQWMVFDDSKMHSASNLSAKPSIVLIVDLERPPWVQRGRSKVENTRELNRFVDEIRRLNNDYRQTMTTTVNAV